MNFWYIILTIVMLSALILLHEFGHFIAARIFKVPVTEFSLGMGPKLLSYRSKRTYTLYSLRAFPIGGYVSMVGEDDDSDDENGLSKKPLWQRMIITAAGAFMNLVTGFIVMLIVVLLAANLSGTRIVGFPDGSSAESDGLMVDDEIRKIDGSRVYVADDLSYEIMHKAVKPIDVEVIRDGKKLTIADVTFPTYIVDGVSFGAPNFFVGAEEKNFSTVMKHTLSRSASAVKMVWESLVDLLSGKYGIENLSGPVGVVTVVADTVGDADSAKEGVERFLFLAVVITMNLGVFNLLPLPALDGGRLLFQLIELVRRKPLKPEIEGYVHFAGIVVLLLFMAVITFKDVITLLA